MARTEPASAPRRTHGDISPGDIPAGDIPAGDISSTTAQIVVIGDLMTDVITHVDEPLALGSDTVASIGTRQGGAGGNVAAWLAALGHPVALIARVGDDPFGREAVQLLESAGVRARVGVDSTARTGTCVVLVGRDGERTMLPDAGANSTLSVSDIPAHELRAASHVHVSGYTLMNPGSREAGQAALASARGAGVSTSVDAASAAPLEAVGAGEFLRLAQDADLLFATLDEAEVLCDARDPDVVRARLTAHFAQVVLKLGPDGAWWCGRSAREATRVPAVPPAGDVVDSTGAGDAFAAAFLAATVRGERAATALTRACALAATVVIRGGARP